MVTYSKKIKKLTALYLYQKKILENTDLIHCTSLEEEENIKIKSKIKTFVASHGIKIKFLKKN